MDYTAVFVLCLGATLLNLPFGFYRMGVRKYSWRWFVAIHLPIPLILVMRLSLGQSWRVVPLLFLFALAGQIAGGLMRSGPGRVPQPASPEVNHKTDNSAK